MASSLAQKMIAATVSSDSKGLIELKIELEDQNRSTKMRFTQNLTISECLRDIWDKIGGKQASHGLFYPGDEAKKKRPGWLDETRRIGFYGLHDQDTLIYKKKMRPFRYKLIDGTQKTLIIDDSLRVEDIILAVAKHIGIKEEAAPEFGLRRENDKLSWMLPARTLYEEGVTPNETLCFARQFFGQSWDESDPFQLELMYLQSNDSILTEEYPCSKKEAIEFAALQFQITFGDHKPDKHVPGFLNLDQFLSPQWRKEKGIEVEILNTHKKHYGLTIQKAKSKYYQLMRTLKSFGFSIFPCQQTLQFEDKRKEGRMKFKTRNVKLGVSKEDIVLFSSENVILNQWSLWKLKSYQAKQNIIVLDFGEHDSELVKLTSEQATKIMDLISGYIELILKVREDKEKILVEDQELHEAVLEDPDFEVAVGVTAYVPVTYAPQQPLVTRQNKRPQTALIPGSIKIQNLSGPMQAHTSFDVSQDTLAAAKFIFKGKSEDVKMVDLASSFKSTKLLAQELGSASVKWNVEPTLNMANAQAQFATDKSQCFEGIMTLLSKVKADPNALSRQTVDMQATQIASHARNLSAGCRNISALSGEKQKSLIGSAQSIASSVSDLFAVMQSVLNDPTDVASVEGLIGVEKSVQISQMLLENVKPEHTVDEGTKKLMGGCLKELQSGLAVLFDSTELCAASLPHEEKEKLLLEVRKAEARAGWLFKAAAELVPYALCEPVSNELTKVTLELKELTQQFQTKHSSLTTHNSTQNRNFNKAAISVCDSLKYLMEASLTSEPHSLDEIVDFATPVGKLQNSLAGLRSSLAEPTGLIEADKQIAAGPPVIPVATMIEFTQNQLEQLEKKKVEERTKLERQLVQLEEVDANCQIMKALLQKLLQPVPTPPTLSSASKKLGNQEFNIFAWTAEEKSVVDHLLEGTGKQIHTISSADLVGILQEAIQKTTAPPVLEDIKAKLFDLEPLNPAAAIPINEFNQFLQTQGKAPTTLRSDPLIKEVKDIVKASNELTAALKKIAIASDADIHERLKAEGVQMTDEIKELVVQSKQLFKDPTNPILLSKTSVAVSNIEGVLQKLIADAGNKSALFDFRFTMKVTMNDCLGLVNKIKLYGLESSASPELVQELEAATKQTSAFVDELMAELRATSATDFNMQLALMDKVAAKIPEIQDFFAKCQEVAEQINDPKIKPILVSASKTASDGLVHFKKAIAAVEDIHGHSKIEEAMEDFDAVKVELDTAGFAAAHGELPRIPGQTRESTLELLDLALKKHNNTIKELVQEAVKGEKLHKPIQNCAASVAQAANAARALASTLTDREAQSKIINATKDLHSESLNVVSLARVFAVDAQNTEKQQNLEKGQKKFLEISSAMLTVQKGFDSKDVGIALDILDKSLGSLKNVPKRTTPPTDSELNEASTQLGSTTKALSAAVAQFTAHTMTTPQGYGNMAKVIATTAGQLISAAVTSASLNQDTAEQIKDAAKNVIETLKELVKVSQVVINSKTPQSIAALKTAENSFKEALNGVVRVLGNFSQETEAACATISDLMDSLQDQEFSNVPDLNDNVKLVTNFMQYSNNLTKISNNLLKATHLSATKVGQVSKELAYTVEEIVNASRMASKKATNFTPLQAKMIAAAREIKNHPLNTRKVIALAKGVTLATKHLIEDVKKNPPVGVAEEKVAISLAQLLQHVNRLVAAAQLSVTHTPNDIQNLVDVSDDVEKTIKVVAPIIRSKADVEDTLTPSLADSLIQSSRTIGLASMGFIRAASALITDEGNSVMEDALKATHTALVEAVHDLYKSCSVLNPSVRECDNLQKIVIDTSSQLEAAILAVSLGNFNIEGAAKTLPQYQNDSVVLCKAIAETVTSLVNKCLDGDIIPIASSAQRIQEDLPRLVKLAQLTAFCEDNPETQSDLLDLAKLLAENIGNLVRTVRGASSGDLQMVAKVKDAGGQVSDAIGDYLSALQSGAQIVNELQDTSKAMDLKLKELDQPISNDGKRYAELRFDMNHLVKTVAGDCRQVLTVDTSTQNKGDVGLSVYKLSETNAKFIHLSRVLLSTTEKTEIKTKIKENATKISSEMSRMVHLVAETIQGNDKKEELRNSFQKINLIIPEFLRVIKQGDIGEVLMDQATEKLAEIIQHLNTSAMFVQAGQLEIDEKEISGQTLLSLQESLKLQSQNFAKSCDDLVESCKNVKQDTIGKSVNQLSTNADKLAKVTLHNVIKLPSITAQTEMITNVKNITSSAQRLILAAKDTHGRPGDTTSLKMLTDSQNTVKVNLSDIFRTIDATEAELSKGEKVLSSVKSQIEQLLINVPVPDNSQPQDVIAAARIVVGATADLSFAKSQDELITAGKNVYAGIEDVLKSSKSVAVRLSPDQNISDKIVAASKETAKSVCVHLEVAKLDRTQQETVKRLDDSSATVTLSINDLFAALKLLPNTENLKLEEEAAETNTFEVQAEEELRKCAEIIEKAASTLLAFKPRERPKIDPTIIDESDINEAILTATKAIATATHKLVVAAEAAQQERRQTTKGAARGKYHADPTWANGLISAAQEVAGTVQHLVKAANDTVEGKGQEEALVSSSRAVAAATAHLVSASKAKSDPNSQTIQTLSAAAKLVATATGKMVDAANRASKFKEEAQEETSVVGGAMGNSKIQELEIQTKIAQLERQLEQERQRLARLRKARYEK